MKHNFKVLAPTSMYVVFSLNEPRGRLSLVVAMSILSIAGNRQLGPNGLSLTLLVKERIPNIGIPLAVFRFLQLQ